MLFKCLFNDLISNACVHAGWFSFVDKLPPEPKMKFTTLTSQSPAPSGKNSTSSRNDADQIGGSNFYSDG